MEIIVNDQAGLQQIAVDSVNVILEEVGDAPIYIAKSDWESLVETVKKMKELYDYLNE